jgi:hypothetical protein
MTLDQWKALMVRAVSRDPDIGTQAVKAVEEQDYFLAEELFGKLKLEAPAAELRALVTSHEEARVT